MRKNKWAKRFAAIIALILAGLLFFSAISASFFYVDAKESMKSLKTHLSDIQKKKRQVKKELAALGNKIDAASARKAKLDEQMELTEDEIDTTKDLIKDLNVAIETKGKELKVAEANLAEKEALLKTRLRAMYENGEVRYLDVLLSSASVSDMLSNVEMVSQIMDYDHRVVEEYTEERKKVADAKAKLEQDRKEKQAYQSSLKQKYENLDDQKSEQQAVITQLNSDLKAKKAQAQKMEDEQRAINNEIARLSREAAKKAAAEAAARRKKQQQSGSTSASSDEGARIPKSGSFTWPLSGYGTERITSGYGYRVHPISGRRRLHAGIDVGVPRGSTIVAAASGVVVRSYMSSSYGNYTVIDHGGGVMTAYAHQSKRLVSEGDHVSAGQKIGLVGSTGNSTGNHLHFEVYVNGSTVNPMRYF